MALLRERSLLTTVSQPMLSRTLFTIFISSPISISRSLASCSRDRSHRRATASTSGSTLPGSGRKRGINTRVVAGFARSTPRCARSSPRILAERDCGGIPGEGAGRCRIYTAASLTVCGPPGALFCTVRRDLGFLILPISTDPLIDAGSST